ncbi:PocR ligand-binding domain-containing protein [Thermoanaerobacterium sp. RBIITD]|uniref:sensor histidine kinase n=1 Tax=Thermoanaerobacterium sp. RBIITD TaxID=1550240 RepID=UPI000BB91D9E|nr:PocR ligand-binding domain-containing protein [Thermoanaerobacterium sp. RBIITD]SNX54714.1 Histidine kinase-, DNA gyrase B-, and HSP90-like ATPase [Thermoanaerobacterium sp. RBIITD]
MNKYKLKDLIDIPFLQDLQDKFAKIMDVAVVTVDVKGEPVVNPSNFSDFCKLVRTSPHGLHRCMRSDATGGFKAMRAGEPFVYYCHSGLTDIAAPIIVNGQYLGCVLCGQVMVDEFDYKDHLKPDKLSKELSLPIEQLNDCLKRTHTIAYQKLKDAVDFLYLFANFIAKTGLANLTQQNLMHEMQARMELERLLKNTELKALESQINPHFLFNTLNTIARMALIENASQTEELIYDLSDILRYSLKNIDQLVDIETEIGNIKKYLFIQNIRYGDRISYSIEISDEILKAQIPVMTLQPLVENSIIHGLEGKVENGFIKINGYRDNNFAIIEIIDNGSGIPKNILNNLLQENKKVDSSSTGLGIQNVDSRIKHFFTNDCGLKIESITGKGTKVLIKIPFIRSDKHV